MQNTIMPNARCTTRRELDDRLVSRIAKRACADRRSVIRRIAGLPVRGRVAERIDRAIRDVLGHEEGASA